jgi:hypothetical protein
MEEAFARLLQKGNSLAIVDKMIQFGNSSKVVGLEDKYRLDEKYFFKRGDLS